MLRIHAVPQPPRAMWLCFVQLALQLHATAVFAQFNTVLNVPPILVGEYESIGSDTQMNVYDGGTVGSYFRAGASDGTSSNIEVNVFGGAIGDNFRAHHGSQVTISGGDVGGYFQALPGSAVIMAGGTLGGRLTIWQDSLVDIAGGSVGGLITFYHEGHLAISGGTFGDGLLGSSDSHVTISGNDFRLNGVSIPEVDSPGDPVLLELPDDFTFTAILADGSPIAFSSEDNDRIQTLYLRRTELPAIGAPLITAPSDFVPVGIRDGQTLVVEDGGVVGNNFNAGWGSTVVVDDGGLVGNNFEAVGATVQVLGGTIGRNVDALVESRVTVSGGAIGDSFAALAGSEVTITDGIVGDGFYAARGSHITISGGRVGDEFRALRESHVNILGGSVGDNFSADYGSEVSIAGGSMGDGFSAFDSFSGGVVTFTGNDFRLDGIPVDVLQPMEDVIRLDLLTDSVFSGILSDGTPFAVSRADGDRVRSLNVKLAPLPPIGTLSITASSDSPLLGVRQGQTLIVNEGGIIRDDFNAGWGSSVIVNDGGVIGDNLEAISATILLSGGSVGQGFDAFVGSRVEITGGFVGDRFAAYGGTQVLVSGGSVGDNFSALPGSEVTIAGGLVGTNFHALSGSHVTILGAEFRVDGVPIAGLDVVGSSLDFDLPQDALLTGVLSDGIPFAFTAQAIPLEFSGTIVDRFDPGTLNLETSELPAVGSQLIRASMAHVPLGIRQGQTLIVDAGGVVAGEINAGWGSAVRIEEGGLVLGDLEASGAMIAVTGGEIRGLLRAFNGSDVSISQGAVSVLEAFDGSRVVLQGGTIGNDWGGFRLLSGSEFSIQGSSFRLDNKELVDLVRGEPFLVAERDITLSGVLANGDQFEFFLSSSADGFFGPVRHYVSREATLTVTLVPEPSSFASSVSVLLGVLLLTRRVSGSPIPRV
ncbi:MAG: hypothetical protein KDA60_03055 [Planctomycetales bacterium]|nr:hypothetical protein [Planctomycetales bacterium]